MFAAQTCHPSSARAAFFLPQTPTAYGEGNLWQKERCQNGGTILAAKVVPFLTANDKQKRGLLTMEFRTFVNSLMRVPAQVLRTGRRLVIRLLAWNEWQPVFLKLAARLSQPLRC